MKKQIISRFIILEIILAFLGFYWLIQYFSNPYRTLNYFLKAIEQKNIDIIYKLVLEEEKQYLNKRHIEKLLELMFYRHRSKISAVIFPSPPADRWLEVMVKWLDRETGQALVIDGRKILSRIHLFRPPGRWKWQVSFTHFVKDYIYLNIAPIELYHQGWTEENIKLNHTLYEHFRQNITKKLLGQWGIKETFPLPAKILKRGKYIVIWKTNQK